MKSSYVLLTAILVVIGAVLGYAVGRGGALQTSLTNNPKTGAPSTNSIFTSQTAFIQGKITKVSGKMLTVQNTTNNQTADFEAADRVFINKFNNTSQAPATPSSDLKTVDIGSNALVNLQLNNGKYQVVSVSILPPAPPFAPPPPGTSAPPPPGLVPSPAAK